MSENEALSPLQDVAFLQAFLDLVIPATVDGRMPAAGTLGLETTLSESIQADARTAPAVIAGLEAVRDAALSCDSGGFVKLEPAARLTVVKEVVATQPLFMTAITRQLYPAYYQTPRVLEGLGEPARPPFPEGFTIEPTDPELVAKLRSRNRR